MKILFHTIAIEPVRWTSERVSRPLTELLGPVAEAGTRELEVYEPHLGAKTTASDILAESGSVVPFESAARKKTLFAKTVELHPLGHHFGQYLHLGIRSDGRIQVEIGTENDGLLAVGMKSLRRGGSLRRVRNADFIFRRSRFLAAGHREINRQKEQSGGREGRMTRGGRRIHKVSDQLKGRVRPDKNLMINKGAGSPCGCPSSRVSPALLHRS